MILLIVNVNYLNGQEMAKTLLLTKQGTKYYAANLLNVPSLLTKQGIKYYTANLLNVPLNALREAE